MFGEAQTCPSPQNLFGFWFAGESEQQCGENWTSIEVRSTTGMTYGPRGYGPKSGTICTRGMTFGPSPLKPLAAQSKKSKQVLTKKPALTSPGQAHGRRQNRILSAKQRAQ